MTCGRQDVPKHVIAEGEACPRSIWIASSQAPRNDENRHSEGTAQRIHFNKRFFGFHPQNDIAKKAAFTLAEVLITLGVIGIVAAMTLPMLVAKYQKLVATTQLKRIYSILTNAELMAIKDFGDRKYWDYPISSRDPETGGVARPITDPEFFKKYYEPYIRTSGVRQKDYFLDGYKVYNYNGQDAGYTNNSIVRGAIFRLADNTCISVWSNNQFVVFTADLNCEKRPNIIGHDVFDIATVRDTGRQTYKLEPPLPKWDNETRQDLIDNCKRANYGGGFPNRCFTLFVYDGWQFKDDYPWR